jgi:hypothetical protein
MTAKKINRDKLATYLVRLYKRAEILRRLQSKNCMDAIFSAICTGMCVARLKHKRIQIEGSPT